MTDILLRRLTQSDKGTFGVLIKGNRPLCFICEDPWNDNRVGKSCVPGGVYKVEPHSGTKYKKVWALRDVPNRSAILIHAGNSIVDTRGCLLPGMKMGVMHIGGVEHPAVLSSQEAMNMLRRELPERFLLEGSDHDPNRKLA